MKKSLNKIIGFANRCNTQSIWIMILLLGFAGFGCKQNPFSSKSKNPDQGKPYIGMVEVIFVDVESENPIPYNTINNATLIRYAREPQDPGVEIKRWPGDTSGAYKYVELENREIELSDYPDMKMLLETGLYQIKHNSVYGIPPSGYYGDSEFFEIKVGDKPKEIRIVLYPAI